MTYAQRHDNDGPRCAFPKTSFRFRVLNFGEIHYPYALPDEPPQDWPRISAVRGIFKHLDDEVVLIFEERKR